MNIYINICTYRCLHTNTLKNINAYQKDVEATGINVRRVLTAAVSARDSMWACAPNPNAWFVDCVHFNVIDRIVGVSPYHPQARTRTAAKRLVKGSVMAATLRPQASR